VKPLIIHPEAEAEMKEAADYYERHRSGLGLDFEATIREGFERIQQFPAFGPFHKRSRLRKYFVRRFPYIIFYWELENHIWIVAVAHAKRRPDYWRHRMQTR